MAQNHASGSLQEQMQRLQNSMQRREKRRDQDRQERMVGEKCQLGVAMQPPS